MFWRLIHLVTGLVAHTANPEAVITIVEEALSKESQVRSLESGASVEVARTEMEDWGNQYDVSVVVTRKS